MNLNNIIVQPTDFTAKSVEEIVAYFNFEYLNAVDLDNDPDKNQFYCGITGDIGSNLRRHNVNGYTACVLCDSFKTASDVEKRLGELGFNIGTSNKAGNGGNENSKIVYMIEITSSFRP